MSYAATTWFALTALFRLRRQDEQLRHISSTCRSVLMITMGESMKGNISSLNDMQADLQELIDREDYEAAEQLRKLIAQQEQAIKETSEQMQKMFGKGVEVNLIKIEHRKPRTDDDE